MPNVFQIEGSVFLVVSLVLLAVKIFAFVTALMFSPDHYRAADKLTKPVWLVILGVGTLLALVLGITGVAIAAVAAGVYLVDVRPRILEIQGKSR